VYRYIHCTCIVLVELPHLSMTFLYLYAIKSITRAHMFNYKNRILNFNDNLSIFTHLDTLKTQTHSKTVGSHAWALRFTSVTTGLHRMNPEPGLHNAGEGRPHRGSHGKQLSALACLVCSVVMQIPLYGPCTTTPHNVSSDHICPLITTFSSTGPTDES